MAVALIIPFSASAFESYHDPAQDDLGYCSQCHPGFGGGQSDTLHALHTRGSDPMTGNCNLCHTGSGRDNPLIMWSTGDADNGLGCMGCHGRDYGETVQADYRGFAITGKAKNSGRGLRRHHAGAGVMICLGCHGDAEPYPENVINPGLGNTVHYYTRNDVSLGGSGLDTIINEDTGNDADSEGLDNDGDGLYDRADPDFISDMLSLTISRIEGGDLVVSWPAPGENWVLQDISVLGSPGWSDLPAPTFRVNGQWQFTASPTAGDRYYRLIKP